MISEDGMISVDGPLVRLEGRVNAQVYKKLLQGHVLPVITDSTAEDPIFMQANAPCHTAKLVKSFLFQEEVSVMDWPAQSPDVNPIEKVWKLLGERTKARNSGNLQDFWTALQDEWTKITQEKCSHLVKSCSRRCQAVIDSKGYHTKY